MARYTDAVCKLCRREGEKLFLKGERCFTPKCAFERRAYAPGEHGRGSQMRRRSRTSDYSRQLRAKQKARRIYGVLEKQFRRYFNIALKKRGLTGLNMLQILELRLDNVVYRLGLPENRRQARQMVSHGHFIVNDRKTNIPSMLLKPGDIIKVREESKKNGLFKDIAERVEKKTCALWLERELKNLSCRVLRLPERGEIDGNLNEQLIVEYYSR
ncbi:MAG TPA: 30S ribosomal protein S4 [Anaerolineae bacterium]|nr:30S ribosomal protein S4 [Anaerolineae bacterium]